MSGLPPNLGAELAALREELADKAAALAGVEAALAAAEKDRGALAASLAAEETAHAATAARLAGVQADLDRYLQPVHAGWGITLEQRAVAPDGAAFRTPGEALQYIAAQRLAALGLPQRVAADLVPRARELHALLAEIITAQEPSS